MGVEIHLAPETVAEFCAWGGSRAMAAAEDSAQGNNISGENCPF